MTSLLGPPLSPQLLAEARWLPCLNGAGVEIPARSLVRISAVDASDVLTAQRPDADNLSEVGVTGPEDIPVGGYGRVTFDFPAWVAKGAGDWAAGDSCGTEADGFTAKLGGQGFKVLGTVGGYACIAIVGGGGAAVVAIYNDSGLEVPARSFVEVTGFDVATGLATVTRPTAPNLEQALVTGAAAIAVAGSGQASWVAPVVAAYDTGGDAPAAGSPIGTQADSFSGLVGNVGFVCLGGGDGGLVGIARTAVFAIWVDDTE